MELTLTAEAGRPTGSRAAGRLRAEGKIPGIVYGLGREPVAVAVEWSELRRALTTDAGLNALIGLEIDGQRDLTIVKDLQRHPVRREVLHVDFLRVDPDAPVEVEVPVVLTGEAKQVEAARGIVEHHLKTLTVKARPADIPNEVEVDIASLTLGTAIVVGDLVLPEGVTCDVDPETSVVAGVATRFSVQAAAAAAEQSEGDAGEGEAGGAEAGGAEATE
jgi:large subunit ribosomal protein L25